MDIIASIVSLELLLLYLYFKYAEIYFLFSIIFFLFYFMLKYNDNDHLTGFRSWALLRNFTLFGKSVKYIFGDLKAFASDKSQMLFVVMGNQTNMGLINGFCMHGGKFKGLEIVVMLPDILFRIPLVRDVLLWMGGVSDKCDIVKLLQRGQSVVYCPSKMDDFVEPGPVKIPDVSIFEFAIKKRISLVPVFVTGEQKRYAFARIPRVQRWFYQRLEWPFPFFFWPRWGVRAHLDIQIGTPMDGTCFTDPNVFLSMFLEQFSDEDLV